MKWLAFFGLVLFIAGVLLLSPRPEGNQAAQPTGEPQAVMVVQASPTPMPEPTLDYVATQVSLVDRLAEQVKENDRLRQEVADLKALNAQQTADATAQAWQSQETIAKAQAAEEDAKARNNEAIAKIKEADNEAKALELKDKQIAVEQIDAETRSVQAKAQARYSWLVLFGLLGLSGGIVLGGRYLAQAPKKTEHKPASQPVPQPASKSWNKTGNGAGETWQAIAPPLDVDAFRPFAEYALSGGLLGINNVCDKANIISRSDYAKYLIPWMQEHDYYGRDSESGGLVLNESGQKDFLTWLRDNPPPLLDNLSQTTPPTGHNHENHDHENPQAPEGEGVNDE